MKKIFLFTAVVILNTSCSNVNWKNENSIKNWIGGKTLQMDGDLVFHNDGTFNCIPYGPNDPTQLYNGRWTLGSFQTYGDGSGELRDLTITFITHGWITDDHTDANGQRYSGFGNNIKGVLHEINGTYFFSVDFIHEKENLSFDLNSGKEITGTTTVDYEFK